MKEYITNKILNDVWLHFKLQSTMKSVNKTDFAFWDYKRIDLFSEYVFYCNLNDIKISINVFNDLLDHVTKTLENKGYKVEYNEDKELLYISQ